MIQLTTQLVRDVITVFTSLTENPANTATLSNTFGAERFNQIVVLLPLLQTMRSVEGSNSMDLALVAAELNINIIPGIIDDGGDPALLQVSTAMETLLEFKWVNHDGVIQSSCLEPYNLFVELMDETDAARVESHPTLTESQLALMEDLLKESSFATIQSSVDLTIRITIELDHMITEETVIDHIVGPMCQGLLASALKTIGDTGKEEIADAVIRTLISTSQHPLELLSIFSYFNSTVFESDTLTQVLKYGPESLNPQ